jgi:uncharacterized protein HemY
MLFNLIKIILIFLFIYFIYNILKTIFFVNRKLNNENRNKRNIHARKDENGKTIELNKNDYKIE